jgi:NAD dependent epimerase/dehydratase family enzyme
VRNADFSAALAKHLHRPALFAVPAFAVRGALRELSTELLASRRVLPTAATSAGFTFRHPTLDQALSDIVTK